MRRAKMNSTQMTNKDSKDQGIELFSLNEMFAETPPLRDGLFKTLGHAQSQVPNTLAYCNSLSYLDQANQNSNISAIITSRDLAKRVQDDKGVLVANSPRNLFYELHRKFIDEGHYQLDIPLGRGETCQIHPTAVISEKCSIGNRVKIGEYVVIKDGVILGDDVIVESGAILGAEGLMYTVDSKGDHFFIQHAGGVIIEDHAVILSRAVIVKSVHPGRLTKIGAHSIIGIGTNVGHDVRIGTNSTFSSHCVIARRVDVGNDVWVGPSSTLRENISLGDGCQVKLGSVVVQDVGCHKEVSGNFAIEHKKTIQNFIKNND